MKNARDNVRKWMWVVMAVAAASQFYFVRELAAAFALFMLGFVVIALVGVGMYGVVQGLEAVVVRLASSHRSILPSVNDSRGPAQSY